MAAHGLVNGRGPLRRSGRDCFYIGGVGVLLEVFPFVSIQSDEDEDQDGEGPE